MSHVANDDVRGIDWKLDLMDLLARPKALRTMTPGQLHSLAESLKPGLALSTSRQAGDILVRAGALRRIGTNIYLNRRCLPPAELVEAAQCIRPGAIISLHTGVGGAHNNPSRVIHAVLPSLPAKRPNVGEVKASTGEQFDFHSLPARFFPADDEDKRLLLVRAARCPTFTAEASLLHWLHLANDGRSSLRRPPHGDIEFADESNIADISGLRRSVLEQTAARYGMQGELAEWAAEWRRVNEGGDEPVVKAEAAVRRPRPR